MGRGEPDPLAFIGGPLAPSFERRVVVIPGGETLDYDGALWRDALVVVTSGGVDVVFRCGGSQSFRTRDMLWLDGLPVRALHNTGATPAVLVAIARTDPQPCEAAE